MEDQTFELEVLVFMTVLALYILISYYTHKAAFTFVHQSTVAIGLGFITALFLKLILDKQIIFSNDFFFSLLLPPIVFAVGYTIKKPEFFQHFLTIVFFGIISTLLSITLQAFVLFLLSQVILSSMTAQDVLLITIITSASDPMTALPLLKSHSHKLNAIVSGESVLNCAVSIILFQTVANIDMGDSIEWSEVLTILWDFTYIFFCSLLLGMTLGLSLSYIFKKFESFSLFHIKETSLILLTGYVVYFLGQFLGLSGIIALFTTAIIFSKYGFNNLSEQSRHGTVLVFDSIRYIFQAFIFAFLGASILTISLEFIPFIIAIIIILVIPLIRFLSVAVLPLLFKISRKPFPLIRSQRRLFWYTGLIRGIIAFALSLQIDSQNSDNTSQLKTVCLIVVMFTTIAGSTFLNKFCEMIGLGQIDLMTVGEAKQEERQVQLVPSTKYGAIGIIDDVKFSEQVQNKQKLSQFEEKYIKPIFIRDQSPNSSPEAKKGLSQS